MLGKLLDGRYQVIQVLSSGGFGETYIAEDHKRPGKPKCVVKHLKPANNDPNYLTIARRLFNTEAETLEKLGDHTQIPRLLAYHDREFYLVQEFIVGNPLTKELQTRQKWTENQVIAMLEDVLGVLDFIHTKGVIHRDIKPDNIIRREEDNRLVLIDFGAVKQVRNQLSNIEGQITSTVAIGTPGYMSAEQSQGKPRPSSDIYALGMIAIQAVTGLIPTQIPEDDNTGEIIWQENAQVSVALINILNKMVRCYFKDRYQSAVEVLKDIQDLTNLKYQTELQKNNPQISLSNNNYIYQPTIPSLPQPQDILDKLNKTINLIRYISGIILIIMIIMIRFHIYYGIFGLFIIFGGISLFFINKKLARPYDNIFGIMIILYGVILLFQGWRLDPILWFCQTILVGVAIFSITESLKLRQIK